MINFARSMQIGARDLKPIMETLMSKLHTLLQPLYEGGQAPVTPSLSEVRAAAELMQWMTRLITRLLNASEKHAEELGELTIEEMTMRHNQWPNVNAWEAFISGLKGLEIPEFANDEDYSAALNDLHEAQAALLKVAREMKKNAPGAGDKARAGKVKFLPSDSQRYVYKEYVHTYYNIYIRGRKLQHQEEMVYYAAIYQGIAVRTGIEREAFHGPDFDDFMYNYCGIKYNRSKTKRGRYRQVGDVRSACLPELWKGDSIPSIEQRLKELFYDQLREFNGIIGNSSSSRISHSVVPKKLW